MSFDRRPFTSLLSAIVDNRGRTCPVGEAGIPLIATNCINSASLYPSYDTSRYVSDETYRTWFRGHPEPGDIIFVCKGSPGRTNWVPDPVDFCIAQDMVAVRADPSKIYPKYLFAALRSSVIQGQIGNMHVGTMIPHFKKGDFGKLNIPVPDAEIQRFIGDLYFGFCERIHLLRETNATLEAIAQALFKSWFVDFDPVRAKKEGGAPNGIDEATAALFPDGFEESALGRVPRGWRVLPFLDACDLQGGAQPPASTFIDERKEGYVRLLQIRDFSTDAHETFIPDSGKLKKVTEDDVLIGRYGSASGDPEKDSLGRVCRGLNGAYNVALMKLNPILVGREFALQMVRDRRFYQYLQGVSSKAVQSGFSKKELGQYMVVVPPQELTEYFETFGVAIWSRQKAINEMRNQLADLRDTLLARLISGQLRLPEAEALVA